MATANDAKNNTKNFILKVACFDCSKVWYNELFLKMMLGEITACEVQNIYVITASTFR